MTGNFYKKAASLIVAFSMLGGMPCLAAHTVSSECDISDIAVPVAAEAQESETAPFDVDAKSAVLAEVNTKTVLYEKNSDEKLPPASVTKVMSLLLIAEALDSKRISLSDKISASEHAAGMGGSQIWLEPGETMTVDELLKAAVIASANDATVALAEAVAGSEEEFVRLMNEKAKDLGMNNTVFKNCTGLDAEGHYSSAGDIAIMSCELIRHDLIKKYSTVWMDTLRNGESELVNTNKLVRFYPGTTGLKTGTTSSAGYCLSATAERDGTEFVAVIMCASSSQERFSAAKKLLDHGFANYRYTCIKSDAPEYSALISGAPDPTIKLIPDSGFDLLLKKSSTGKITKEIKINENITAPVKKGEKLGKIIILNDGVQIGAIDLLSKENAEKINFKTVFLWLIKGIFTL